MLGDAVMSLPFIRTAVDYYDVHVACAPGAVPVFEQFLSSDKIIVWTPPWLAEQGKYDVSRWSQSGLGEFLKRIKAVKPQVAVSVWADARVHWLMALSGAKERVGFPMIRQNYYANHLKWRKKQLLLGKALGMAGAVATLGPLLTHALERRNEQQHHLMCWEQVARALLMSWDVSAPWLVPEPVALPPELVAIVRDANSAGQPVWMAHAGARLEAHRWPVEKFDRVLREELQAHSAQVILLDSPEVTWSGPLKHTFPSYAPLDVKSLFAVLNLADALVCNDTGVAHVAAALGKPVVPVFTAGNPNWFGPWGSQQRAVRRDVCEYHPCFGRCLQSHWICLDAVTVEMVSRSVRQLQNELLARA